MAQILTGGIRLNQQLDKLYRHEGRIMSMREMIEEMPDNPSKEITDGQMKWNRRAFNRMDFRQQDAYQRRLNEMRIYTVNGLIVPKIVFDAVVGTITSDVDTPKPELPPMVIAA